MDQLNSLNLTCLNLYSGRLFMQHYEKKIVGYLFVTMMPFELMVNVLLVLSLVKTNQYRKSNASFLMALLGFSDCLNALISLPLLAVIFLIYPNDTNCGLEQASFFFVLLFINTSGCLVFIISIDRYLKLNPKLTHNGLLKLIESFLKRPKLYFVVTAALVMSLSGALGFLLTIKLAWKNIQPLSILTVAGASMAYLTLLGGCILYAHALFKLKAYERTSLVHKQPNSGKTGHGYFKKAATTVLLIQLALLISYLPFNIVGGMMAIIGSQGQNFVAGRLPATLAASYALIFVNGIFNALIVLYRNDKCQQWILSKLCTCQFEACLRKDNNENPDVKRSQYNNKHQFEKGKEDVHFSNQKKLPANRGNEMSLSNGSNTKELTEDALVVISNRKLERINLQYLEKQISGKSWGIETSTEMKINRTVRGKTTEVMIEMNSNRGETRKEF